MGEYVDTLWEIYLERARYLLNVDELLEEMHGKTKSEITDNMKVELGWNAGTVCCSALVDTDEGAKTLKKNPGRVKEVNAELNDMGVNVLDQYAVLGNFDFLTIVEADDETTIVKQSLKLHRVAASKQRHIKRYQSTSSSNHLSDFRQ